MPEPQVVVIGGGVAGAATAFALARRRAAVTLVDAACAGAATAAGAGIVQPWSAAADGPYHGLYSRGAAYYPELLERLAAVGVKSVDFRRTGSLVVSADASVLDAAEQRLARRRAAGAPTGVVERLSSAQARELFPPLQPGLAAVFVPGGGRVDGRTLRDGLLTGAKCYRATVTAGRGSLVWDGRTVRVRIDRPGGTDVLSPDAVVVAAGAWSDAVLAPTAYRVDVEPQRGQLTHLRLDGVDTSDWPSVLRESWGMAAGGACGAGGAGRHSHYLVAFDDSRVVAGATRETGSGFDARPTAAGLREVLDHALVVAPGLADATVLESRVGLRPLAAGGVPRIGAAPGVPGVFVTAGFGAGGLTMAPLAGEALASVVLGQAPGLDLAPFAP